MNVIFPFMCCLGIVAVNGGWSSTGQEPNDSNIEVVPMTAVEREGEVLRYNEKRNN